MFKKAMVESKKQKKAISEIFKKIETVQVKASFKELDLFRKGV